MAKFLMHYLLSVFSLVKYWAEKAVRLTLFLDFKFTYFVTKTGWGYSLYLYALSVVLGTKTQQAGLFFLLRTFHSLF